MTQSRTEAIRKAELALAETFKECRAKLAAHAEADGPIPRKVRTMVEDALESIDASIESLVDDRDEAIDWAVYDIGR